MVIGHLKGFPRQAVSQQFLDSDRGIMLAIKKPATFFTTAFLILLIGAGFAFRLNFLLGRDFYIDEYFSMLAALMTLKKGVPVLPSQSFYDHGLIVSYLSALSMLMLGGFSEIATRWPLLLISTLTIPIGYKIAEKLFSSTMTGLVFGLIFVFEPTSVVWGGSVRMYALAYLMMLLATYCLFQGVIKDQNRKYRILFILCAVGALWSHYITAFALSSLILVALVMMPLTVKIDFSPPKYKGLALEIILALAAAGLVFWVLSQSYLGTILNPRNTNYASKTFGGVGYLAGFLESKVEVVQILRLFSYYLSRTNLFLSDFALVAFIYSAHRVIIFKRKSDWASISALFVAMAQVLTMLIFGLFANEDWLDKRYLYILIMPFLMLLAAYGVVCTVKILQGLYFRFKPNRNRLNWLSDKGALGLALVMVLLVWGPSTLTIITAQAQGGYAAAYAYIKEKMKPGDLVMNWQPAACYLYLSHCDYYINEGTPKLRIVDGKPVDTFIGSPYINNLAELNKIFTAGQKVWFVVDKERFLERYSPVTRQQFLNQMVLIQDIDDVFVFQSRPGLYPVTEMPLKSTFGDFEHLVLQGYTLDFSVPAGNAIPIITFWKPIGSFPNQKVKLSIHLINEANQIVAQADHELFGVHDNPTALRLEWNLMKEKDGWLRDGVTLPLNQPLPPGTYKLFISLYNPNTLERYPLKNDTSGENVLRLTTITLPQND